MYICVCTCVCAFIECMCSCIFRVKQGGWGRLSRPLKLWTAQESVSLLLGFLARTFPLLLLLKENKSALKNKFC